MVTVQASVRRPQTGELIAARLHQVSKNYGAVQALKNFSLDVRAGELTAVLGPNGAGKTTAIKLLLGLARPRTTLQGAAATGVRALGPRSACWR